MIVEERIYTLQPGTVPLYLKAYAEEGLAIQQPILGHLIGYFHTDFGPLNQVVHLWAYDSHAERERRRKELFADPAWLEYIKKIRPYVLRQENKLLIPAPFSPNP